ncbi:MAG: mechanosensitive ion channel family protein [Nitrospirota bacterium]
MLTAYAATVDAEEVASGTVLELAKLVELVVTKIPLWIAGAIVIVLSVLVAKLAKSMVKNKLEEKGVGEEHEELQILGGRIAYSSVLILGITIGLKIAGIDLTTILAAVAFGIGFALKDLIMNFLAGIMLLVSHHFTIGDFISVGGTIGKVEEIQSRVTVLKAIDGTKVIVPNAQMFKKQVTSFTSNPFRKIALEVGVDYRHKLENVIKICMSATKHTKGVLLEPKPSVVVSGFGENSIDLKIKAWVSSTGGWIKIKSDLAKNVKAKFDEFGITIPWPIRTIAQDKDNPIEEKDFMEQSAAESAEGGQKSEPTPAPGVAPVITSQTPIVPQTPQAVLQEVEDDDEQPLRPLGEKR